MSQNKKVQWENIGKIAIIVFAIGMAFFFPFQKYFTPGEKTVKEAPKQNMTDALMEKEPEVRDYNTDPEIYWRRSGDSYLLYVNGKQIAGTESSWSGDDLMVHDPNKNITYRLPNFKNLRDNQLREGEIAEKQVQ